MESGEKYGGRLRPSRDRADRQRAAGRIARKGALQSGPYRWGNICGRRGTERTGNVPRAGWPARVPCNPAPTDKGQFVAIAEQGQQGNASGASGTTAPTVEFVSIAIRKVPGGKDAPAGGACPAPTDGGFAAIAGQGQAAMIFPTQSAVFSAAVCKNLRGG